MKIIRWIVMILLIGSSACNQGQGYNRLELPNSLGGKKDQAKVRVRLTESSPIINMAVRCDHDVGCEGSVEISLILPDPCQLLNDPRCGIGSIEPAEFALGTITVTSNNEGIRKLPFHLSTEDGKWFSKSIAAGFSAQGYEEVDLLLEKNSTTPDLLVDIVAEWNPNPKPGAAVGDLEAFLGSIHGLTFEETSTAYSGYRAYLLYFEQPEDHNEPNSKSFSQRVMLHHRDTQKPMILYTSGYQLERDYLSELSESLGANQLSTEQRFFGNSVPADLNLEDWKYVTIKQAAADHHRIVQMLQPFYKSSWLSTGHSKGGMTSIYHRRFFPQDVDATVAYVAPISYTTWDQRYVPFLDTIGVTDCRNAVRTIQRKALERRELIQPRAEQQAKEYGLTFEHCGSHAKAFEFGIVTMEWSFWQSQGVEYCESMLNDQDMDDETLYSYVRWVDYGYSDSAIESFETYNYQASLELGHQDFSTSHLNDLLQYDYHSLVLAPEGTNPVHNPSAILDVQDWVVQQASKLLFIYGEYDPWSGGAFEIGDSPEVLLLIAPHANHGANLRLLTDADRKIALDKIEYWIHTRPEITPNWQPSHAPSPPNLLQHISPMGW